MIAILFSLVIASAPPTNEPEAFTSTPSNPYVHCMSPRQRNKLARMSPRQRNKLARVMEECQATARLAYEGYVITKIKLDAAEATLEERAEEIAILRDALTSSAAPVRTPTAAPDLRIALGIEGDSVMVVLGVVFGLVAGVFATVGAYEIF